VGAILRPDQQFILIEPARKRTSFLNQVKSQLNLSNVSVVQDRAESLNKVACTISRGTFPWPNYKPLTNSLDIGGASYLWIGQTPSKEDYCHTLQEAGFEVSWESYQLGDSGKRHMGIAAHSQ
jgi:16S rRNA G527 N7-methylase RsmG